MRKAVVASACLMILSACGGGEGETQGPKTPAPPPAVTTPAPAPTAEAPKEEAKPKETLGQLQEKTGRGIIDAINAHDAKKVASFYTENAIVKVAGAPAEASGREAIAQSYQKLFEAFPDYKTAPTRLWVKGEVVVMEWIFNGTHQGDLWGVKGTEKKAGVQGVDVYWFTAEGQVKEHHVYYDGGTILAQVGVSKQKVRPIPALPTAPPQLIKPTGAPEETKNIEPVKAMNAAFESKKEADFVGNMTETAEYDDMSQPQTSKGKTEAKKFFKEMTTAFPDSKSSVLNAWGVGDYVITEASWTGTHKAAFFGIPATKKSVTSKGLDIFEVKDGKIVKGWGYSNGADFMQQLGLMPSPSKPGADKKAAGDAKATEKKPADPKAAPKK